MKDRWLQGRLLPVTLSLEAVHGSKSWTIKEATLQQSGHHVKMGSVMESNHLLLPQQAGGYDNATRPLPHLTSASPGFVGSLPCISVRGLQLLLRHKLEADASAFAHFFPSHSFSITVHAELSVADQKNASDLGSHTLTLAGEEKQQKNLWQRLIA